MSTQRTAFAVAFPVTVALGWSFFSHRSADVRRTEDMVAETKPRIAEPPSLPSTSIRSLPVSNEPLPLPAPVAELQDFVSRLSAAFEAHDVLQSRAALDEATDNGDTRALPALESLALSDNPELAGKIIVTIGKLAELASPGERDHAVDTMSRWLIDARHDDSVDARANRSVLVGVLGDLNTAAAHTALLSTLDDEKTPLYLRTLIVGKLANRASPEATESIRRFQRQIASPHAGSEVDAELLQEAEFAARDALSKI